MLMLECEAKVEEGWDCQAFMEAFGATLQACPPETHGALMYPQQLLISDVPLAAILGMIATTWLQGVTGKEAIPAAPTPSALQMPAL